MDPSEVTGGWNYATLPQNISLGADCFLERRHSFERFRSIRRPGLVLGDRVKAYAWTQFNIEPTGLIEIGDDTTLVGAVFMCAEHVRIGRRVVVSYNVTIADSDFHPRDPDLRLRDAVANSPCGDRSQRPALVSRPVFIEDDACIGIGAIILKGVRIGRGARVGAGSVVTTDVPDGVTVVGNPSRSQAEED